ncbi:MAG: FAD-dependent oxidoreductase, partial [Ginsengibacter sp.]
MITIQPIHKYDCDVLIVGGGPAGSALAFYLAKQSIKVIVVEAEKFPRDKICGDGVSPIALAELQRLGITESGEFLKANEINKVGLFIEDQKVMIDLSKPDHLPFHARIIPRLQLDNWIYKAAQKSGAIYLEESRVCNYIINEDVVIAEIKQRRSTQKIKSKIIVGADGSRSVVARLLNGSKPPNEFQLLGLRAYYEGVNGPEDRVDIFFSGENFPGIYWMFPTGQNAANIGLAMVSKTFPK